MSRKTVLALSWLVLFNPAGQQAAAEPPIPVIDMHVHAYSADPRFGTRFTNPLTRKEMTAAQDAAAHERETFAAFERYNIVRAVVSGGDHDGVLRWREREPGRILVGYAVNDPAKVDPSSCGRSTRRDGCTCSARSRPSTPASSPRTRSSSLSSRWPRSSTSRSATTCIRDRRAPYVGFPKMRVANGNPLLLEDILVRHPRLRLYVMHAGRPMLDETVGLLYAHPQVYVEVGVIAWSQPRPEFHRYLRRLVEAGYGDRVMFGTDQMVWPEVIGPSIEAVESAAFLSADQKKDVFHRNAARFLRLEGSLTAR